MKESGTGKRSLESLRLFPYVAWGLTILFTFFVYQLAVHLKEATSRLQAKSAAVEIKAKTPVEQITDFETF